MQTNNNNIHCTNKHNNSISKEDLLLQNKEIINTLVLENMNKKDKSYMSIKEMEIVCNYEKNLVKLLEKCPVTIMKQLIEEGVLVDNETLNSNKLNANITK